MALLLYCSSKSEDFAKPPTTTRILHVGASSNYRIFQFDTLILNTRKTSNQSTTAKLIKYRLSRLKKLYL